jgi:hypothetical protein
MKVSTKLTVFHVGFFLACILLISETTYSQCPEQKQSARTANRQPRAKDIKKLTN